MKDEDYAYETARQKKLDSDAAVQHSPYFAVHGASQEREPEPGPQQGERSEDGEGPEAIFRRDGNGLGSNPHDRKPSGSLSGNVPCAPEPLAGSGRSGAPEGGGETTRLGMASFGQGLRAADKVQRFSRTDPWARIPFVEETPYDESVLFSIAILAGVAGLLILGLLGVWK